jgi:hypothetical protein
MFPFHLWNSHTLLDGHEILHEITRHPHLCHGFDPIHFSYVVTDLWFIEVGACLVDFFEHAWTCFDFLIFIDQLPLIQMSVNLICISCYGLWLIMNYLMIYWIVYDWFWFKSCCWLLWASICHALISFAYEMMMMIDMNVNPIEFVSWLFEYDFDWNSFAVLTFSSSFDPRLVLVVLLLTFEFMFSGWPTINQWDQYKLIEFACFIMTNLFVL